jgi:hypothetical protein
MTRTELVSGSNRISKLFGGGRAFEAHAPNANVVATTQTPLMLGAPFL